MANYQHLEYGRDELIQVMELHYAKIIDFVTREPFKKLMIELSSCPSHDRPIFVQNVLLNDDELSKRGVTIPEGILIQRSAFGDRRPTLFAVKHFLPDGFNNVWENVNLTFDNEYDDFTVSRDRATCWRPPLSPHDQAYLLANG